MSNLYYFGCIGEAGHHYWDIVNHAPRQHVGSVQPGPWGNTIDSEYISPVHGTQGDAYLHYKAGWTALAIVDRTGDSRPNSRSVFITEGHLTFVEMFDLVAGEAPTLLARIGNINLIEAKP